MTAINVRLDASQLIERMEFVTREAHNAIRQGLAKAARAARRDALDAFASDANVTSTRAKRAQPTVKIDGLVASWSPSKSAAGLGSTGGVSATREGGLLASTFVRTGGGSASLVARHGFIIRANGGTVAFNRTGFGPGTHRRVGLTKLYAENANAGLAQDDGAPRKAWQTSADQHVEADIGAAIQMILDGIAPGSDSGTD